MICVFFVIIGFMIIFFFIFKREFKIFVNVICFMCGYRLYGWMKFMFGVLLVILLVMEYLVIIIIFFGCLVFI